MGEMTPSPFPSLIPLLEALDEPLGHGNHLMAGLSSTNPHAPMTPAIHPLGFLIKGSETLAKGYHIVP